MKLFELLKKWMKPKFEQCYKKRRKDIEKFFVNSMIEESKTYISPSNNYKLVVVYYKTNKRFQNFTKGIVYDNEGSIITEVKRNHPIFWHTWHIHANGNEYLLCGEDYQGYTIINLTKKETYNYFSKEGFKERNFCWISAKFSPQSTKVAIHGAHWGSPFEIAIFDFTEPDKLPLKRLGTVDKYYDIVGYEWKDESSLLIVVSEKNNDNTEILTTKEYKID